MPVILLLATCSWPAIIQVTSPPLRYADDTRSAFAWSPRPAGFPRGAMVRVRVIDQHRPRPNPWEVAWVVLGDERRFIAFVPKPTGWHVELFDAGARPEQRYLASGQSPVYPVGEPIAVSMTARHDGLEISAETLRPKDGRTDGVRLAILIRWTDRRPAPAWWGRQMEAGVYVEDCAAELRW
jgi:hypothetical protein